MSERTAGFAGFNCNLQKTVATNPSRGTGYWNQFVSVRDRAGRTCGYMGGHVMTNPGTAVMDLTDPNQAVETAVLTTAAMLNPGESLRVHAERGLLVAGFYSFGGAFPGPAAPGDSNRGFDVYDIGTDCRHPQLLASTTALSFSTAGLAPPATPNTSWPATDKVYGHEGAISPDGLTYYLSDTTHAAYHAIDLTDPTNPRLLASFQPPGFSPTSGIGGVPHGLSLSDDGNRGYFTLAANNPTKPGGMVPQTGAWRDGFMVVDTSEIQARKPNAAIKFKTEVLMRDNSAMQMTIPFRIQGKQYLVALGEGGTGQFNKAGIRSACAAGLTPFAMPQIFDIEDEANPKLVSKLRIEANDPANCAKIDPEVGVVDGFIYDVHMCSIDNRDEATTMACGYFQSGIRVFDIRDPMKIKEIAYYNPPSKPGGAPGYCAALPILDATAGMVYSTCTDVGMVSLKFAPGTWPFPESKTPKDKQL